jgi:uncharacterized SAM-dependent methyltransferase
MVKKIKVNSSFTINEVVFKDLIKRGYSVEGNNKVYNIADSKLWYLTPEQAKAFLDLESKDPKQKMFANKEIELLKKKFNELTLGLMGKNTTLIDLGCGNGEKAFAFAKGFKDKSKIRYCPIDINPFMVSQAMKTFSKSKAVKIAKLKSYVLDFFDFNMIADTLKKDNFKTSLLMLLGGNLENSDVHELLHEVRSSMHEGDYLLIGNKLAHPDSSKMVSYYNQSKYIDNMLFKTVEQLGISRDEAQYGARFRGNRVEMFYTLKNDKTLQSKNKKIELKKDDKIIVTISYKYSADSLKEVLMMYFDDVELFPSSDGIYALALCKK